MKKGVICLALVFLLINTVIAESPLVKDLVKLGNEIKGQELTGIAKTLFKNERISFHISNNKKEEVVVGIIIEKGIFQEITSEPLEKPTMNAYTTEKVVRKIIDSKDPLETFADAIQNKQITYKGVGFFKKIKFGFISLVSSIIGWFKPKKPAEVEQKDVEEESNESEQEGIVENTAFKLLYTDWGVISNIHTLYIYDFATGNKTMIVNQYVGNLPSWSPNGEKILYDGSERVGGTSFVNVIKPDGTEPKRLAIGFDAQWFPNGEKIIFRKKEPHGQNNFSIYTINSNGENLSWAAQDDNSIEKILIGYGYSPKVSPNNEKIIYYQSPPDNNRIAHIYIKNSDGSGEEQLIIENVSYSDYWWSPNSEKIVFKRRVSAVNYELFVANRDGSNQISLGETEYGNTYWSPDSLAILHSKKGEYNNRYLYITQANGSHEVEVGRVSLRLDINWHPSENKFAYSKDTDFIGDIAIVNSDGSNELAILDGENPHYSSDGRKIAFQKKEDFGNGNVDANLNEIYIANADGSGEEMIITTGTNPMWQP